jgi:hypothetical protein
LNALSWRQDIYASRRLSAHRYRFIAAAEANAPGIATPPPKPSTIGIIKAVALHHKLTGATGAER